MQSIKRVRFTVVMGLAIMALAVPAAAHVSTSPSEGPAGGRADIGFAFSHGCGDSPTTTVAIKIPDELNSVTPNAHPGWDVEVVRVPLDPPIDDGHGGQVTERVDQVIYTAKEPLDNGIRDVLTLSLTIPEDEGAVLSFPTVQTCEEGEHAWIQIASEGQDPHDLESPAPQVTITAASGEGHGHGASDDQEDGHSDESASDGAAQTDAPDTLTLVSLGVGALGVILGGAALVSRKRN